MTLRCESTLPSDQPCQQEATRRLLISTIPGSGDGKLITLDLCEACYERDGWAALDLSSSPWHLALLERQQ